MSFEAQQSEWFERVMAKVERPKRARPFKQWDARALTADLCAQLRGDHFLAVCEATLGRGRVDVMALRKTFGSFRPQIFEIKISRSDFLSDVRGQKWRKYLDYGPVAFAVPDGLIHRDEVPKDAGLRVRFATGWRWMKAPSYQYGAAFPLKDELLTRFMLCLGDQYYERGKTDAGWRDLDRHKAAENARTEYAREVMRHVNRLDGLRAEVERYEKRAKEAHEWACEMEEKAYALDAATRPHRIRGVG